MASIEIQNIFVPPKLTWGTPKYPSSKSPKMNTSKKFLKTKIPAERMHIETHHGKMKIQIKHTVKKTMRQSV